MPDPSHVAFLAMLEPVYDRLSRYAMSVTGDEQDGEDLVSETVLIAFEKFEKVERAENVLSFLVTIASRLHKRKRYRERNRRPFDRHHAEQQPETVGGPDHAAEIRLVHDALDLLPAKTRETVILFGVSDFSLEEIREIQGGTLSGVKSRLKRGREQLATLLGEKVSSQKISVRSLPEVTELRESYMILAQENYVH